MSETDGCVVDAELLPATINSARTLALIAKETPEVIMARAIKAAKVLQDVIVKKKNPVIFNKEIYLEFEDWQTVANFYNASAKVVSTKFVDFGGVKGFECHAELVDKLTGQVLSAADAMCLNDEEKWSTRTKYEWHYVKKSGGTSLEDPGKSELIWEDAPGGKKFPKKQRVNAGEVSVPLFQLRSMAQTRACAKVIRNVFAWVVVLAGYKPTPAEEMDGVIAAAEKTGAKTEPDKTEPASADPAAAEKKEPERKSAAKPAAKTEPPQVKTATGFVSSASEPNKGGYVSFTLEGVNRADGRPLKLSTQDRAQITAILDRRDAGEKVSLEYTKNENPAFADNIVKVLEVATAGDAQE